MPRVRRKKVRSPPTPQRDYSTCDVVEDAANRLISSVIVALQSPRGWEELHLISVTNAYVAASYLYYEQDVSLMTDSDYDGLCKYLHKVGRKALKDAGVWKVDLIYNESSLSAGSGFHLHGKTPIMLVNIAGRMAEKQKRQPITRMYAPAATKTRKRVRRRA